MTQPVMPDVIGAFIVRTASLPNTVGLVADRVSGRLQLRDTKHPNDWDMPTFAIVYRIVPGPIGIRKGTVPVIKEPIQVECYGPNLMESRRLWRTLYPELFPDPPVAQGFIAARCAVMSIEQMGSAAPLQENETAFPRTVATLLVEYSERPTA